MPVNERGETRNMQNPGDLRVPEGVTITPTRRVLLLGEEGAFLVPREEYDEVSCLYPNGSNPNQGGETEELEMTSIRVEALDKG